jgi:hypothetical protein
LILVASNATGGQSLKPVARQSNVAAQSNIEEELGASVLMRDGVRLAADVFRPSGKDHWPTVLVRTPYNRKNSSNLGYHIFMRHGFALVIEDVRGRFASQGTFGAVEQEGPDASDTINWIAAQPWSDGRVAMAGSSYLGIVQWWAAIQDNPHLMAIAPMNSGDDEYLDRFYSTGGALKLGHRLLWVAQNFHLPSTVPPPFASYIYHLPVRTADVPAAGRAIPVWRTALLHPTYDAFWDALSIRESLHRVTIPVLSMGGWFDNYGESELDAFSRLSRQGTPVETWIGPWAHDPALRFPTRDFGPEAVPHIRQAVATWLQKLFVEVPRGVDPGELAALPRLHLFIMGPNVWREEHEWPLARTTFTPIYLDSKGHAGTVAGDGVLRWQSPANAHPDTFTYDPKDPVPTTGGPICCDPKILPPGPLDQTNVERRLDVLVYTSPVLPQDVEVTGPVRAKLYVSTSANDTDFTAKLVDVFPNGRPLSLTDGIQRLRYRLSLDRPVFVKRNARYQISVDMGVTSCIFAAGHRIRLEISSSNFPRYDRNLNTTHPIADETKISKAKQTVYHEENFRSALILPVIPKNHRR